MTISLITFAISLVCLSILAVNKHKELNGQKTWFSIGNLKTDRNIAVLWKTVVYMVTHVSVRSIQRLAKQAVLKTERFFINKVEEMGQKFSMVGNMVTGYDLPKNRGSVSFFLKNIEDHKKTMRGASVRLIK
jgi:hypothetical protein